MQNSFPFKGEVVKVQTTTEKGGRGWGGGGGVCPQPGHRAQVAERVGEETNAFHRPLQASAGLPRVGGRAPAELASASAHADPWRDLRMVADTAPGPESSHSTNF